MTFQRFRNRTGSWVSVIGVCALGFVMAGCQSGTNTSTTTNNNLGVSPIVNYKQKIVREAMVGLHYHTGRVTIDQTDPRGLVGNNDLDAAAAKYDAGQFDLVNQNNFLSAIRNFSDAVIMVPDEASFQLALGQALDFKGKTSQAEVAYRTALDLDPEWTDAHQRLAEHLYAYGRTTEAIDSWRAALALDYNLAQAHGRLALAYYYQNDYTASAKHLREADRLGYETPAQFRPLLAKALGQ